MNDGWQSWWDDQNLLFEVGARRRQRTILQKESGNMLEENKPLSRTERYRNEAHDEWQAALAIVRAREFSLEKAQNEARAAKNTLDMLNAQIAKEQEQAGG